MLKKIISGGQTGVDRGALDAAITNNFPHGGWCPQNRLAEDGALDKKYNLQETPSKDYSQRTEWNARDSEGTLVLHYGEISGGTADTIEMIKKHNKPYLVVNLKDNWNIQEVIDWINRNEIEKLNVAGPRESKEKGIYEETKKFMSLVLEKISSNHNPSV